MPYKKQLRQLAEEVQNLVQQIGANEGTPPQELLTQGLRLREEVLEAYRAAYGISDETDVPKDFLIRAFHDAIDEHKEVARDNIGVLVYEGAVDPLKYYELATDILDLESDFVDVLPFTGGDATVNQSCLACIECSVCAICVFFGVESLASAISTASIAGL